MTTAVREMVEISAGNGIPAFMISADIADFGARAIDAYAKAPALTQLRYAAVASSDIRSDIRAQQYKGEFTADFVDYNVTKPKGKRLPKGFVYVELVQRPESVKQENSVWIAEGGRRIGVALPPDGYQVPDGSLLYTLETGLPARTIKDRDKAIKELSKIMPREQAEKEASYFVRWDENHERLSPVSRGYWADERGPWGVYAGWGDPLGSDSSVGSRVVRSLTEAIYGLDEKLYREVRNGLSAIHRGNIALSEIPDLTQRLLDILDNVQVREEKLE